MANVNVDFSTFSDPRFKILGSLLGIKSLDAIGRCTALWMYCIERDTEYLSPRVIDILTDTSNFTSALQEAALAEPTDINGQVRIRGTTERIRYLTECRRRQKLATEAARLSRIQKLEEDEAKLELLKSPTSGPILDPISGPILDPISGPIKSPPLVSYTNTVSDPVPDTVPVPDIDPKILKRKNTRIAYSEVFEDFWVRYLKKGDKKASFLEYQKQKLTEDDQSELKTAIQNYFVKNPEYQYRKNFENFLKSDWRQHLQLEIFNTGPKTAEERRKQFLENFLAENNEGVSQ